MSDQLRFDGKVVIITGAGGGLGKCYALTFAERGAKVVVNDLGGEMTGDGKGTKAADKVVEEIRAKNGIAVPNYDSVENGEKIVQTAVDNFGRVDIIINNAGILRDRSFLKTSDLDWDLIQRVHLRGSFILTRAAWPYMQKNKFGRVIMTSSGAGIYGNFGQANYSAAKLGLLGLSNTLSIEGQKYNIKCNTIAPVAKSRLTETVMPEDILNVLKPEFVSPLVLYLCHENTEETGSLFEVGGGWVGKLRWQKSSGAMVKKGDSMSPEDIRDNWSKITTFDSPIYHSTIGESTNFCINASETDSAESSSPDQTKFKYDFKDAILYALSLGVSSADDKNLKFLYENHEEFCVLPSYGVIPAFGILFNALSSLKLPHNLTIDPAKILHGEHYLELFRPLSTSGNLTIKPRLVDVLDKGSGALLIINIELLDEKNDLVALNQFVTFSVGSGNFGGKRDSNELVKVSAKKFDRKADKTIEEKTTVDQAVLYRLNGDLNPLHIDPSFSAILGFNKPILHGLCSFGFAVKHIIQTYCGNDVKLFKSVKVRFSKPVLPGQTIQTNMWLEKETSGYRVYFECRVLENQSVVITGAYADLHDVKLGEQKSAESKQQVDQSSEVQLSSENIFAEISKKMAQNPDISKGINAVYSFRVTKGNKSKIFLVDLKKNKLSNHSENENVKAECNITISDDDFVSLASGTANAQQMFMKGKLKVKGNIMLAQKLEKLFKNNAKL
ncbi:peroxisomal multifunctional enzyme type 2 [Brachionus plicatilis]|uniref:Peroxisomal multifunctional enzyme type 2 n=1 Tax=Brachionus plicatilis TaxID=10195 RepID=A0A3M7QV32_BRAPC|nr:peroxisomal multifunctional enzyme type 2 [Brachionus plicatilis]